jgi:ParB family transcriptional regulator, chromosome partitioning protein
MNNEGIPAVKLIPISQIKVLNPRSRNRIAFDNNIVSNISNLGLKKPITVAPREDTADGKCYDLVCGQGRLEAFIALGQTEIPAIVRTATKEECFLMSLVENLARRNHNPIELLREIGNLKARGYTPAQIARKIDLAKSYVVGVSQLLSNGEERLLAAVESGRIPLSVAMQIASSDEEGVQKILCDAYEGKGLRGKKLQTVRRLIEQRRIRGKRLVRGNRKPGEHISSADALVRVYRREADKQKLMVKRAQLTEARLLFIVSALKKLFQDDDFIAVLRSEGLDSLPSYLAERIQIEVKVSHGEISSPRI